MQQEIKSSVEILLALAQLPSDARILVGITGGPGSGKTEFAAALSRAVNLQAGRELCCVIGMDGWHYSRAQLDLFPDPVSAHSRRGAHDTFDSNAYLSFVKRLRSSPLSDTISAPSFSHSLKDPIADDLVIAADHKIVLLEGLYVTLDIEPWREAAELLDERWIITFPEDQAEERIWKRHLASGICANEKAARERATTNDIPNGRFLLSQLVKPTRRIQSIDDPGLGS